MSPSDFPRCTGTTSAEHLIGSVCCRAGLSTHLGISLVTAHSFPTYRRFKRRGLPQWSHLLFHESCGLRRYTSGSAIPFIRSPINIRGRCLTTLNTFPLGTVCRFARWPTMGSGHACQACFAAAAYAATACLRLSGLKVLPERGHLTSLECAIPGTLCTQQR